MVKILIVTDEFKNVYGHENVKSVLHAALSSGRIGHAYIFTGKNGVGKFTMAMEFARLLVNSTALEHPDIVVVTNEWADVVSKSNTLLVDTAKKMRQDIYIKPYSAKRKVYIVKNADTMNAAAQNSILKVFEEPPLYCTIILLAENSSKFLSTILSRASEIRFNPLSENMVAEYLMKNMGFGEKDAAVKAVMSGGSIGMACGMIESRELDEIRHGVISHFMNLLISENRVIFDFSKFLKSHKDDMEFVFSVLKSFLSDLVHIKFDVSGKILNVDKEDEIKRLAKSVTKHMSVQFLSLTLKYEKVIQANANFRIAVFCMACEYWEEIHGRNYRSSI